MTHSRLEALHQYAQANGWRWQRGKPIEHGEQVIIGDGAHQITVNFYPKRGKLVLGGPESPLKAALAAWIDGPSTPASPAQPPVPPSSGGSRLDALKAFVQAQGWNWGPGAAIPYGEQIIVADGQATALVNFWPKRGSMQVQGGESSLKSALQAWSSSAQGLAPETAAATISGAHIGMDESGKGDWFGPLVVAAVYVDEQTAPKLRQIGVQDSKALAATSIQRLAAQIERIVPLNQRHVRSIAPQQYNHLYARHGNINLLLAEAYAEAAAALWQVIASTHQPPIVCDQFAQRTNRLDNAFALKGLPAPIQQHHAESASLAVAAASILASAAFSTALADLAQDAGHEQPLPKGASDVAALQAAARSIIKRHGPDALGQYAKLNFKPVRELL